MALIELAERGWLPDWAIRIGIRRLLSRRRLGTPGGGAESHRSYISDFVQQLRQSPLAVSTDKANDQHYEVPAEFFRLVLGPRLKYSCCLFEDGTSTLEDTEERMLDLTCRRAEIADGMDILELGCGWGSLTLWMAERFPACHVTAVSNSHSQREFIESQCRETGLTNVEVLTADICQFQIDRHFDRVISVEMFEHLRNYELLFRRIAGWLRDDGKLFTHIFCHRDTPYLFETEGADNWMGRHFFTGGMMPSAELLLHFQDDLAISERWRVAGNHYARTCEAWLKNLDRHHSQALALFETLVGQADAPIAVQRWRMFFMACAELFRYAGGTEWFVAHYLFDRRSATAKHDSVSVLSQASCGWLS